MGLFVAFGIYLLFCIYNKIEKHQDEKIYQKYQEDKRRRGLKTL